MSALSNDRNIPPPSTTAGSKIAVISYAGDQGAQYAGGGAAAGGPTATPVSPLPGITARGGRGVDASYAKGPGRQLPVLGEVHSAVNEARVASKPVMRDDAGQQGADMSADARRIPPPRWAIVGSSVTVHTPSLRRPLNGRVCELDGTAIAVETELGILRVRPCDCSPMQRPKGAV